MSTDHEIWYVIRGVAAIFTGGEKLEKAIAALQRHGFSRPDILAMASHNAIEKKLSDHFERIEKMVSTAV